MTKIKKAQGLFSWVVILSECSHVFCCVLPSLVSVLGVMVGLGLIGAVPAWLGSVHEVMHHWELPVIIGSGAVLALGWSLHYMSRKMDCHDTGCVHGSCEPKKKNAVLVLQIATFLFVMNVCVYMVFHRGLEQISHYAASHSEEKH